MNINPRILVSVFALCVSLGIPALVWISKDIDRSLNTVSNTSIEHGEREASRLVDLHNDSLLWTRNLTNYPGYGHFDFESAIESGVVLQVMAIVTGPFAPDEYALDRLSLLSVAGFWPLDTVLSLEARYRHQIDKLNKYLASDSISLVRNQKDLADVFASVNSGSPKIGVIASVEGLQFIGNNKSKLRELYEDGVRIVGLTHFVDNQIAGAKGSKYGLTEFGIEVVQEIVNLGMIIDLAHASTQTIKDVVKVQNAQVIISHTGLAELCPLERNANLNDVALVADKGGLVGVGLWQQALCGDQASDFLAHVELLTDRGYASSIAIGSDFDGGVNTIVDVQQLPSLFGGLMANGLPLDVAESLKYKNAVDFFSRTLPTK